ncbi:MAG: TetR/AcrR family transcriptional regulator [Actinomycetota bacterium]
MGTSEDKPSSGSYHHGNLREALLDAVGAILEEKGIGSVSLREAARRAGVSHGAPAHHFGDKLGMLTAYTTRGFELFAEQLRAAADGEERPEDKINAVGIAYLRFAVEHRSYFELMFRSEMHNAKNEEFLDTSTGAFSVVTSIAEQLLAIGDDDDSGPRDPTSALPLAFRAWSQVHGLATLWLDGAITHFWDGDDIYELAQLMFEAELPSGSDGLSI